MTHLSLPLPSCVPMAGPAHLSEPQSSYLTSLTHPPNKNAAVTRGLYAHDVSMTAATMTNGEGAALQPK